MVARCAVHRALRDGAPIRLMLLGEKLIAFRDKEGRVGVMDHRCPHRVRVAVPRTQRGRRYPLHLSRRWNATTSPATASTGERAAPGFQAQGEGQGVSGRRRAPGWSGSIWIEGPAPPLPAFEILDVPDDEVSIDLHPRDCNYLQALEGEIDTSHRLSARRP